MGIEELEKVAALGWRAPEEEWLGGWLLRAAGGFTGRANSALAIGDPGMPLDAASAEVCRWYADRGLPAMIAVPYPVGQPGSSAIDRFLAARGWTVRPGAATVMTAMPVQAGTAQHGTAQPGTAHPGTAQNGNAQYGTAHDGAGLPTGAGRVELSAQPGDDWLALYHYRGRPLPPIARTLLCSAPWQAFATVQAGRQAVAIGRVAVAGDWAGLTAIEVDPGHRRRGLATAVTAALVRRAVERGATGVYLQVEDGNTAAHALYRRADFASHHGYHYRVAPG